MRIPLWWIAIAAAVFVTGLLGTLYRSGVWPGETATIHGSFMECSSSACNHYVLTSRHLEVRFYQPGLFGRTIVAPVSSGTFETRIPLGAYQLVVDGCTMVNGQPISFIQAFEGGRDLQWTIDAVGVCRLGPEPPSGIFCCSGALPAIPQRALSSLPLKVKPHSV